MSDAMERLRALVSALDVAQARAEREQTQAARDAVTGLRRSFVSEYRAMERELADRGSAPKQSEEEYVERRFREIAGR